MKSFLPLLIGGLIIFAIIKSNNTPTITTSKVDTVKTQHFVDVTPANVTIKHAPARLEGNNAYAILDTVIPKTKDTVQVAYIQPLRVFDLNLKYAKRDTVFTINTLHETQIVEKNAFWDNAKYFLIGAAAGIVYNSLKK